MRGRSRLILGWIKGYVPKIEILHRVVNKYIGPYHLFLLKVSNLVLGSREKSYVKDLLHIIGRPF